MILKGNQRAGGTQLALHLLKTEENEHVDVHEVRGFISDTPMDAFKEAYAVSRGTKCKQFLFSLSLSPPQKENVPVRVFEQAIIDIENKIGLAGQPRVVVFHEKEGRRHAHCVWSRIDVEKMRAINLPHFKLKLRDVSRQLYIQHGWQMPRGLMNSAEHNPLNFTQAEWQQAKRLKQDPRDIKQAFQDCWAISDSRGAFTQALQERGYYLAKGDRRGFVAVDWRGEVYAVSRWVGIKAKEVRTKLGDPADISSVDQIKKELAVKFSDKLKHFITKEQAKQEKAERALDQKRFALAADHQQTRLKLKQQQTARWIKEAKARSARLPTGLKALWFRVSGEYKKIKKMNEVETIQYKLRDELEMDALIHKQLTDRQSLQNAVLFLRHSHNIKIKSLNRDIADYLKLSPDGQDAALRRKLEKKHKRRRTKSRTYD